MVGQIKPKTKINKNEVANWGLNEEDDIKERRKWGPWGHEIRKQVNIKVS